MIAYIHSEFGGSMAKQYNQDCYLGMKIRIDETGSATWQPSRFAGNHGARFSINDKAGLGDMVLAIRPNGANIRLSRTGEVFAWKKEGIEYLGQVDANKLSFDKFDVKPKHLGPGMLWVAPYDGELHHWFDGKIWARTTDKKRAYWDSIPAELLKMLNRFKPEGGSFMITPWNYVAAIIQPKPTLPQSAMKQWSKLNEEEKRLLQIKKDRISMVPIHLCQIPDEFELALIPPADYSKPLSEVELDEMDDFLSQYMSIQPSEKNIDPEPKTKDIDIPEIDEWEDEDDFFDEGLDLMYKPTQAE